jgi:acyl dehydratase
MDASVRHFEDFAAGQTFHSRPKRVEKERILSFGAEFDPQPQHLSDELAAKSQFGELVASGWHTAALSMRLMLEAFPPVVGGGQGMGIDALSWPAPVRPGDELRVEVEILETRVSRSRPDKGLVKFQTKTLNQNNVVVMRATHTMMAALRGAPDDARRSPTL